MKPMLAKKWNGTNIQYPCYIQPKFNGIRALWLPGQGLQSRDGHFWTPGVLSHIEDDLEKLKLPPGCEGLDGEIYKHGMSLQQINSRAAVIRKVAHPKVGELHYVIFDSIADEPFQVRRWHLEEIESQITFLDSLRIPETVFCTSEDFSTLCFNLWKGENYEGLMYRVLDAPYGREEHCGNKENRWDYLLKRKSWEDLEGEVVDVFEGEDGWENTMGGIVLKLDNGKQVKVGSGKLTLMDRKKAWVMKDELIGTTASIQFECLSDSGVPLKPVILCLYGLY